MERVFWVYFLYKRFQSTDVVWVRGLVDSLGDVGDELSLNDASFGEFVLKEVQMAVDEISPKPWVELFYRLFFFFVKNQCIFKDFCFLKFKVHEWRHWSIRFASQVKFNGLLPFLDLVEQFSLLVLDDVGQKV